LGFEFQALLADPDWVLAHFILAPSLTTLRDECRFAHAEEAVVVRYQGLSFPELAFLGHDPGQLSDLAAQLVGPDEPFYLLLNEGQAQVAERAFAVEQAHPVWQMLFAGDPAGLDAGGAVSLGRGDLEAMRDLAVDAGLIFLEADPFRCGPAFGVWDAGRLVAMGATHCRVPGAAEIGNVGTRTTHRRRGYAWQVVAALVRTHAAEGRRVFLVVFQTNHPAVRLYERLGFARLRPMFLMRCRLRSDGVGQASEVSSHS
jgi:ribosomal protein S18 acetylase RimI-like enzyme